GLDRLPHAARLGYRALAGSPGFLDSVQAGAPSPEVAELRLASRPVSRRGAEVPFRLEDLRAIPWVFAWTQSRVNLPGWYGLGSGLATIAEDPDGVRTLREMYEGWSFFRSLLETAELSLVIADMPIAALYMELGEDPDLAARITEEHRRTVELVLTVNGNDRLLAERPMLRRAVELRNPYVDALSFIQVR